MPLLHSGNLVDKTLVKALKKEEKRKGESKEPKEEKKKKKSSKSFRPPGPPGYGYGWQNPGMGFQYPPLAGPQAYQQYPSYPQAMGYPRAPETRICTNCRQQGHLMRNCPHRPPPSSAIGAAPK